jgi:DNA sulfur modification protein DndC
MSKPEARRVNTLAAGLREAVEALKLEIRELYGLDEIPWVIGYSGGKDSTAVLQLVWSAIEELPVAERRKPIHVISTDTLVENPIVARWVTCSLEKMTMAAEARGLPIKAHRLTPEVQNSFWVNLLGKGYPAPRPKFRWCTERLKIMPSNRFIRQVVQEGGEAILLLGTRKAESTRRASTMKKHERGRVRDKLSPNSAMPNCQVFTPIENWTNDDVWLFLMQVKNPWGYDNKDLLTMYAGASEDGECPLVVDTTTPSCGDSRFGCWVCTMVDQDRSMAAMVQNDDEKQWMLPLLKFRDLLAAKNPEGKWDDRNLRDFRRNDGSLTQFNDRLVHGPYKQSVREDWLKKLLQTQRWLREKGPDYVRDVELITLAELEEIRRIWVVEKHEIEDNLPSIYTDALGVPYPGPALDENPVIRADDLQLLRTMCQRRHEGEVGQELYGLVRGLLDVELRYRTMTKRKGLFDDLQKIVNRYEYRDAEEAQKLKTEQVANKKRIREEVGTAEDAPDKPREARRRLRAGAPASGQEDFTKRLVDEQGGHA